MEQVKFANRDMITRLPMASSGRFSRHSIALSSDFGQDRPTRRSINIQRSMFHRALNVDVDRHSSGRHVLSALRSRFSRFSCLYLIHSERNKYVYSKILGEH